MRTSSSPRRPKALAVLALLLTAVVVVVGHARPADAAPITAGAARTLDTGVARHHTQVASNGTKALVVWSKTSVNQRDHVWGALMDVDGSASSAPFRISMRATDEFAPDVAWNGSSWLVVWAHDFEDDGSDIDVRARLVSSIGSPTGTEISIDGSSSMAEAPTVAAGPSGTFQVVYAERATPGSTTGFLQTKQISATGVAGAEKTIRSGFLYEVPEVIWVPGAEWFVVAYTRSKEQVYAAFDPDGIFRGSQTLGSSQNAGYAHQIQASLATDGTRVLAVWNHGTIQASWITLHPVNHSPVFEVLPGQFQGTPTVAFNGMYLVVWEQLDGNPFTVQLKGARFKRDGTLLDDTPTIVEDLPGQDSFPALTSGSSATGAFALGWQNTAGGTTTLRGAGVTASPK